jgi:anti-sigma factor ChrR (cupin superfamily)
MSHTTTPPFGPRDTCPDQALLAAHNAGALSPLMQERVGSHLQACDFCGAASQLLTRLPSEAAAQDAVELPLSLRLLAQTLLDSHNRASGARRRNVA